MSVSAEKRSLPSQTSPTALRCKRVQLPKDSPAVEPTDSSLWGGLSNVPVGSLPPQSPLKELPLVPVTGIPLLDPITQECEPMALQSFSGRRLVLVFYPHDFEPTAMHSLMGYNEYLGHFTQLNCAVVGCSSDSEFAHRAWLNTSADYHGVFGLRFPLASDMLHKLARSVGVFDVARQFTHR
ncbi:thioredoxin-like protein [Dimargaris cristalligena]|uniref:Thioredoxin-like protein n=1 Tax=Dimargaris cristalligena TaxID=215637 RepID=A0A4V1J4M0_9FUNG|nr:thioredoxin-like protein [Dimargaris cristalligena]|eukprot:RKP36029.1 thioredoxin-like protein [Dimargaris cristalligena]